MILSAFQLERDWTTENHSFGYERFLWCNSSNAYMPKLGCPLEISSNSTLKINIVKIIELHNQKSPVIIERLAWKFNNKLYPYRVKYIYDDYLTHGENSILFLSNINTIHQKLTGFDFETISPFQFYLDRNIIINPYISESFKKQIYHTYSNYQYALDGIASQYVDPKCIKDFITAVDTDTILGSDKILLPKLSFPDHLSHISMTHPINTRDITFSAYNQNPFDTSAVSAIQINNPATTIYSPKEFHKIAMECESVTHQYSDVIMEYILSSSVCDGYVKDNIIHLLVSRYLSKPNFMLCCHACLSIVLGVHAIATQNNPTWMNVEKIAKLTITYGDEALIEFFTIDRKHSLFAVHLDLAMIALCASDIIAVVNHSTL